MCENDNVKKYAEVADELLQGKEMLESYRRGDLISIYKGKGSGSYRNVKLLKHEMKVIERIFEKWLRNTVRIDEMQIGFMPGRGTVKSIFVM